MGTGGTAISAPTTVNLTAHWGVPDHGGGPGHGRWRGVGPRSAACPAGQVGAGTGLVRAAGGLGGFVPPLVMGGIYGASGSYAWGLLALAAVAAAAMTYSFISRRRPVTLQGA